jgi:hypothetical protein
MNLRDFKTELLNKPTGRLILFFFAGGVVLAFVLLHRGGSTPTKVTPLVPAQATAAKGYTIDEGIPDIKPLRPTPTPTPAPMMSEGRPVAVKTPPPIPQAIFAMKENSLSENYLPYGRLLKCELVNTVDSSNLETPNIGLVTEDVWRDGRPIITAGTEVHGVAKSSAARDRVGSEHQWMLVFQNGKQLPLSGTVLDYAPDEKDPGSWKDTDGSAGLWGYQIASDKYAEAKAMLASMVAAGAGAFPGVTNIISPLTGGATQLQGGGMTQALSAGIQAGGQLYAQRLLDGLQKNPYYIRVPGGTLFYLYVTQTVDLDKAARGLTANSTTSAK